MMKAEEEITAKNENDIFTCDYCKKTTTRKEIRKIRISIPFCKEELKTYYCGCMGWD